MSRVRALASPASLKGVLSARDAAASLVEGFGRAGAAAEALPIADGGEGTADVLGARVRELVAAPDAFGRLRQAPIYELPDAAVIETAQVVPLDAARLDPFTASSRGLAKLISHVGAVSRLLVCLGGTATMDAGEGLLAVLDRLPAPTTALCDVRARFLEAPRLFGRQKGASDDDVVELERRFAAAAVDQLAPYAHLPGSGAAGGLGAALASLGAELVAGAPYVLRRLGFRERARESELVVTGEGIVDATTLQGKAVWKAVEVCREERVRCVVFGGRIDICLGGAELAELSGDASRARHDLVELGERLGRELSG
jgi:glycerate 2-kinase